MNATLAVLALAIAFAFGGLVGGVLHKEHPCAPCLARQYQLPIDKTPCVRAEGMQVCVTTKGTYENP